MSHKPSLLWGALLMLLFAASLSHAQSCAVWNYESGPWEYSAGDPTDHISGVHVWRAEIDGSCYYTVDPIGADCDISSDSSATANWGDPASTNNLLTNDKRYHQGGIAVAGGSAASNGAQIVTQGTAAVSFLSCVSEGCNVNVSINAGVSGVGASISFANGSIWNQPASNQIACSTRQPYVEGGGGGGGGGGGCSCGGGCNGGGSPIIVDTTGDGFHLTDPAKHCTFFNLRDNKKPPCLSWPILGSGNAWLALPDENGSVNSSKQLFGNFTPQAHHKSKSPNGFLALAEYDANFDLIIDAKDPVWSRLRLWIDEHCYLEPSEVCVSRPNELHELSEFGIENIALVYDGSGEPKIDKYGNWFKFRSHVNVERSKDGDIKGVPRDSLNRTIYDVWLMAGGPKAKPQECE